MVLSHSMTKRRQKSQANRSIHALNIAQLLGALNDNIFKFLSVFFLINLKGEEHSSSILFLVGSIFVIPFLIFSTYGGNLADRYSKKKLIVGLKGLEVLVMAFGLWAFSIDSPWGCYVLLFMMSTQSALFGPSKYGIIPELVDDDEIPKANGLITAWTYIAIIGGSFTASAITQISNRNFVMGATLCTILALIGFAASFKIEKTKPKRNKRKMASFMITDAIKTMRHVKKVPYLSLAILGSSFFLFLGAFIQLNIVPYAQTILHSTEAGGYLFSPCALGIVLGAYVAGKTSSKRGNMGLACLASFGTAIFFFLIPAVYFSIPLTVVMLICLGFSGGLYIVPFDSFIQAKSPEEKRGQIIATSNFLSFCGVLLAPICLAFFSGVLRASATVGFILMGAINVAVSIFMTKQLPGQFFNYASRKLVMIFHQIKLAPKQFDLKHANAIILHMRRFFHVFLMMGFSSKIHLYVVRERPSIWDFFLRTFKNIHFIYAQNSFVIAMNIFKHIVESSDREKELPCLVIPNSVVNKYYGDDEYTQGFNLVREKCEFVTIQKNPSYRRTMKKFYKLSELSIAFEAKEAGKTSKVPSRS